MEKYRVFRFVSLAVLMLAMAGCGDKQGGTSSNSFIEDAQTTWSRMTSAVNKGFVVGYDKDVAPGDRYGAARPATRQEAFTADDRVAEYADKRAKQAEALAALALLVAILALLLAWFRPWFTRYWESLRTEEPAPTPETPASASTSPSTPLTTERAVTEMVGPPRPTTPTPCAPEKEKETEMETPTSRERELTDLLITNLKDHNEVLQEMAFALIRSGGGGDSGVATGGGVPVTIYNNNNPGFHQGGPRIQAGDNKFDHRERYDTLIADPLTSALLLDEFAMYEDDEH